MSTQYKDGSFGETRPFNEAMEEFMVAVESNTAKAFHVGTREEIHEVKKEESNAVNIKKLEASLADLKADMNISKIIDIPNYDEIKNICGDIHD